MGLERSTIALTPKRLFADRCVLPREACIWHCLGVDASTPEGSSPAQRWVLPLPQATFPCLMRRRGSD